MKKIRNIFMLKLYQKLIKDQNFKIGFSKSNECNKVNIKKN